MRKSSEKFFNTQKKIFFQDTCLEKKCKKIFGKFFKGEKIFKIFFEFFSKKSPGKKLFFECRKHFQNFFSITFYIVSKIFVRHTARFQKRMVLVLPKIQPV